MDRGLRDMRLFLGRWERRLAAGMAADVGMAAGIPAVWLCVYGVGFWNWSPALAAAAMLAAPALVMAVAMRVVGKRRG